MKKKLPVERFERLTLKIWKNLKQVEFNEILI